MPDLSPSPSATVHDGRARSLATFDAVAARHGWRCVYCDGTASTVDHVIPRRLRKKRPDWLPRINAPENLMPACETCNLMKGGQDVRHFLRCDPARLRRLVRAMAAINPGALTMLDGADG